MGFGLISVGFLFLVNPNYSIVDVLPDFIGLFMIFGGLTKISYINEGFSNTRKLFFRLAILEIVKFVFIAMLSELDSMRYLLFAFVFGILELLCFIPAVSSLFTNLDNVGILYSSSSINKTYISNRLTISHDGRIGIKFIHINCDFSTKVKRTILEFYIFRTVTTILCEIPELKIYGKNIVSNPVEYLKFKPLLYGFMTVFVLVFGIVFIIRVMKFFLSIRGDSALISALSADYANYKSGNQFIFTARKMHVILTLFAFSIVFSPTLYFSEINVLPNILSALLLIIASIILMRSYNIGNIVLIPASLTALISVITFVLQYKYVESYDESYAALWYDDAWSSYLMASVSIILEYIALGVSIIIFAKVLNKIIKKHISMSASSYMSLQYNQIDRENEIINSLKNKAMTASIFVSLSFICNAMGGILYLYIDFWHFVSMTVSIISIVFALNAIFYIKSEVYDRTLELRPCVNNATDKADSVY